MNDLSNKVEGLGDRSFVEGIDYYYDAGLMVLTAEFLIKRGCCCCNGCRHCPYSDGDRQRALEKKFL